MYWQLRKEKKKTKRKEKKSGNTYKLHLSQFRSAPRHYKNITNIMFDQTNGIFTSVFTESGP